MVEPGAVLFYLLAAGSQLLLAAGVLGARWSGVAGTGRAANLGLLAALWGTALIAVGDLASILLATSSSIAAGRGSSRASSRSVPWSRCSASSSRGERPCAPRGTDWRRFTPLAIGIWSLALVGVQFTSLLPTGVGIYALCFLALGVALAGSEQRAPVAPRAGAQRA